MKNIVIALVALAVIAAVVLLAFGAGYNGPDRGNAALRPVSATIDAARDHGANTAPPAHLKPGAFPKPRYGYGPILVGMTAHALRQTGQVRSGVNWPKVIAKAKRFRCASLRLTTPGATVDLQPDRATGRVKVSALFYGPSMTTSKGIGLGSTLADLQQAYPKVPWVKEMHQPGEAPMLLGHRVLYEFGIQQDKHISEILIYWQGQTCFS